MATEHVDPEVLAVMAPCVAMLNTNARGFTKGQAAKELTDNAVQSTILLFHTRHQVALRHALERAVRAVCALLDASGQLAEAALGYSEKLDGWVQELLSLSSLLDFVRAVDKRDLTAACGAPGFALSKPPFNLPIESLGRADRSELGAFWTAAEALATCVRDRAEPGRAEHPQVLLRYDTAARTLECVDNGRGVAPADMRVIMVLADSAHGRDADIGLGGVSFKSHGSLCSGQFSSYGIGALSAAASLCRPDDGQLERGNFIARSRAEGSTITAQLEMDFDRVLALDDWLTQGRPSLTDAELSPLQHELTAREDWGDRFTSVRVCGVDQDYCDQLGGDEARHEDERRKLVAYFEDVYYPILHDGLCGVACTRPLQTVQLTIEFTTKVGAPPQRFVLGRTKHRDAVVASKSTALVLRGPSCPPCYGAQQPTIAEMLARNRESVQPELERHRNATVAQQASSLVALLGDELTLRCLVALPPMSPGGRAPPVKALLILFYYPLTGGTETMGSTSGTMLPNGVLVLQNGCRLADQEAFLWDAMRPPVRKVTASRNSRATITDAAYTRVSGLLLLPPHCPLVQNKARLKAEAERALRDNFSWAQVPEFPTEDNPLLTPADAEMTTRGRAAASSTPRSSRPSTLAQLGKGLSLQDLFQTHFLARSLERDEDVLVDDRADDIAHLAGTQDDWTLFKLTFMRKELDSRKAEGLWIRYPPISNASGRKVLGRVKHFISRGGFPDPSKSEREGYEAVVERRSADENDHDEETVSLKRIMGLDDVDLGADGWAKYQIDELRTQRLPAALELMHGSGVESSMQGAVFDRFPEWIITGGVRLDKRHLRFSGRLPVELVLSTSAGERLFARNNSEAGFKPLDHRDPSKKGLHWFKPYARESERLIAPGTYVLSVSVMRDKLTDKLRWMSEWCTDLVKATFSATFTISASEPEEVHLVWQKPLKGAQRVSTLRMGCGELPPLHLLVTDCHGRVVSPTGVFTSVSTYMEVAQLDKPPGQPQWLPVEYVEREHPAIADSDLELEKCTTLHKTRSVPSQHMLSPYVLRLKADDEQCKEDEKRCFKLPLVARAKPYRCVLKLCAKMTVILKGKPEELTLHDSREFELIAGRPHVLETPALPKLRPGLRTERVACRLLDRWGNACVHADDGRPLRVRRADGRGLEWADAAAELSVSDDRLNWGNLFVPPMDVNANPGDQASVELVLVADGPPIRARLAWRLEQRRLAFHADGAQLALRDSAHGDDVLVTTLTAPEGAPVESVMLRVHLPLQPGVDDEGAAVGAFDNGLSGVEVELEDSADGRGGGAGGRGRRKLTLIKGEAELSFLVAPRAFGSARTLTARCRGLTAVLVLSGEQSPPVGWRLHAEPLSARANEPVELTLALVNARGEAVRERVQLTTVSVRVVSADASAAPAAADADGDGEGGGDGGDGGRRGGDSGGGGGGELGGGLKVIRQWAIGRGAAATMSASCKLLLARAGMHTLEVVGLAGLVPGLPSELTEPRVVTIQVRAGAPCALRVERVNADEGSAVAHRQPFALRATVVDSAGNPCDAAAELRGADWRLDLEEDSAASFQFGKKPARVAKGNKASHSWDGLQLRVSASVALPRKARLVVRWQPSGGGPTLSATIVARIEQSGAFQALCVEHARYEAFACAAAPTVVRARLRLDDGRYELPVSSKRVWVLAPAARSRAGQSYKVFGQCLAGDEDGCWLSFDVRVPEEPGERELRVCYEAGELDDAVATLVVAEAAVVGADDAVAESYPPTEEAGAMSPEQSQPVVLAADDPMPPDDGQRRNRSDSQGRSDLNDDSDDLEELSQGNAIGTFAFKPPAAYARAQLAQAPTQTMPASTTPAMAAPATPAVATPAPLGADDAEARSALRSEYDRSQRQTSDERQRRERAQEAYDKAKRELDEATRAEKAAQKREARAKEDLTALVERRTMTTNGREVLRVRGITFRGERTGAGAGTEASAGAQDTQSFAADGGGDRGGERARTADEPAQKRLRLTQL